MAIAVSSRFCLMLIPLYNMLYFFVLIITVLDSSTFHTRSLQSLKGGLNTWSRSGEVDIFRRACKAVLLVRKNSKVGTSVQLTQ